MRSRLGVRLAVLFALGSAIPVVAAGLLTAEALENDARQSAMRRVDRLARLGRSLVERFVERGTTKLATVGRLLGAEIESGDVGSYSPTNDDYRNVVLARITDLVDPPDVYVDLHYYAAGIEPQFVANAGNPGLTPNLGPAEQAAQQLSQINSNIGSPVVDLPLRSNRMMVAKDVERTFGVPTLRLSAPVASSLAGPETALGVLVGYLDLAELAGVLADLALDADRDYVALTNTAGEVLAAAGTRQPSALTGTAKIDEHGWTVHVAESGDVATRAAAEVRRRALQWTGAAVVLALVLSLAFASWLVRPVAKLTDAARAMAAGDLTARAGLERRDEIGTLGQAFDRMADALEQLDRAKSDFVGTVSHELRTPLTSMQLSLANVLDGLVGALDDRQRTALGRVQADVERMIRIVEDLLALARLQAGVQQLERVDLDLAALARDAANAFTPLTDARNVTVAVHGTGTARASDRALLRRVVDNLLDNAIKFSPAGGTVTLRVDGTTLEVRDEGPGFDAHDGDPFAPFVQGRSDGVKNRGVGLGLAIVHRLCELLGARVTAANAPDGRGAILRIET